MRPRRILFAVALLLGCGKTVKPTPSAAESAAAVLDMARARPAPDPARARFNIRLQSPSLEVAGSTGGGLVVARPRGRLDIFGPLGGSLVTFATDGERVDVVSTRDRSHLYAADAEVAIREVTDGGAGLYDVLSVLVGDLPFDEATARSLDKLDDGRVHVSLDGPREAAIDAILDPALGTPERIEARDGDGVLMLSAEYGEYLPFDESGVLAPDDVVLFLPALDLTLELRFKTWKALAEDEVDPAVFSPAVPEGFASRPLEEAVLDAAAKVNDSGERP